MNLNLDKFLNEEIILRGVLGASIVILLYPLLSKLQDGLFALPFFFLSCFVIPEAIGSATIVVLMGYTVYTSPPQTYQDGAIVGFEILMLLGIPMLMYIEHKSIQAYITSISVLGFPMTSITLLSGIAMSKRDKNAAIFSSLPILYLLAHEINANVSVALLVSIVLFIIASFLFTLEKPLSFVGIIPAIISLYMLHLSPYFIISSAVIGLASGFGYERVGVLRERKEIEKLRQEVDKIKKIIDGLNQDSRTVLEEMVGENFKMLLATLTATEACSDKECISNKLEELKKQKAVIEEQTTASIPKVVEVYSKAGEELKKIGITLPPIKPLDKKITFEEIQVFTKLMADVEKNIVDTIQELNKIIYTANALFGTNLEVLKSANYNKLSETINVLIEKRLPEFTKTFLDLTIKIINAVQADDETTKSLSQYLQKQLSLTDLPNIYVIISKYLGNLAQNLQTKVQEQNILPAALSEKMKTIVSTLTDKNKPVLAKIKELQTNLQDINVFMQFIAHQAMLKDIDKIIKQLKKKKCVELNVPEAVLNYIAETLKQMEQKIVLDGNKICLQK